MLVEPQVDGVTAKLRERRYRSRVLPDDVLAFRLVGASDLLKILESFESYKGVGQIWGE